MDSRPSNRTENSQNPQKVARRVALAHAVPWQIILSSLLAIAGLGWGIWLRVLFFRSFPDPFSTPDTWSYLTGVYGLLEKGQFDLFSMRTPGFPLLVWLTLVVFKNFAALNVIHGALTLLSALAIALAVRAFGGPWRWPAALAAGFLAVHPHLLFWEHFVMTEGSFQAFFVLALVATTLAILRPTTARAAAAGTLAAIVVLIRPQGIFLIPLMLLALAWVSLRLARRKLFWVLAAAGAGPLILLGGWSARNAAVHGFFGLSNVGPLVNFSVSARWIDLDSPKLAEDKALIADSIRRYRAMPDNFNWVAWSPEGPTTILSRKYGRDIIRRDQVLDALAREAILHHPTAFVVRGLDTTYTLVTGKVSHWGYTFGALIGWDENWNSLSEHFPVNPYRVTLDESRFPVAERERIFENYIRPTLVWETSLIRVSLGAVLLALLTLPLQRGPRRLATAVAAISVALLILTATFFTEPAERYLSVIHGGAALAGALAAVGLLERWRSGLR